MIIGKIDRKLKLHKRIFTTNSYGERVFDGSMSVTIYGDFNFRSGNTKYDADALINDENIECLIRYRTNIGVSPQFYIRHDAKNYTIKSIKEVGRKEKMILSLELSDTNDVSLTL